MKGTSLLVIVFCLWHPGAHSDAALPLLDQGNATYDPNTGLEWLDLSFTAGKSYNEVVNGWGGFTTDQGYRFAHRSDIAALFQHAGQRDNDSQANRLAAGQALVLLGTTLPEANQRRSWMLYDPASEPSLSSTHVPSAVFGVGEIGGGTSGDQGFFLLPGLVPLRDYASPEIGSALVRVVPEPKSWVLFVSASGLLAFWSRRKQQVA